jgi:hypothetical protein
VLSPITAADEWTDRSVESGYPLWQSVRCPSVFSKDGGATWYDLDDADRAAPVLGIGEQA